MKISDNTFLKFSFHPKTCIFNFFRFFSSDGFLTVEEKDLKTIYLGFKPNLINNQFQKINYLKNEFKKNSFSKKIDNIDLTNPDKPKIKVFKP